ncbi:MAG: electron transfer flavoprotein subunit alpha/FixB family protein, partial [Deltaproteobacteria bacterium]|nr:electron transfer flavoprotein subunit alpha/FixB family protein [Deltaproteobacteria bacterium]
MARILVFADHHDGELKKSTLQTITLARELAGRVGGGFDIVVLGQGVGSIAQQLTGYGAERVLVVDGPAFEHYLAEPSSKALAQLAKSGSASFVLASSGTTGKDMLPRVAALLGFGMVAECTGLAGSGSDLLYKRPMYAGNIIATVKVNTPGAVISVRGSEFAAATESGGTSPVESASVDPGTPKASFVRFDGVKSERPELTEADVVVAGGRGLKDGENFFKIMEPLADALGAAIGASRAAVDSGFCANDYQVGQTGKVVAPKLYIAVAISGAIQHLAGMKNSKCIVAINKDPEAPIFQ